MRTSTALWMGGAAGLTAVLAGTFGAHGFKEHIAPELLATFEIGVRYHMYHALAMLACAGVVPRLGRCAEAAVVCWGAGLIVFSGSLYALALSGQRWLGMVTPVGGVLLIVGWGLMIAAGVRLRKSRSETTGSPDGRF